MKKSLILFGLVGSILASCSSSNSSKVEQKEIAYEANLKGFVREHDNNGNPRYVVLELIKVTDGWDGGEKKHFSPKESGDKLIKVELKGYTTSSRIDLGVTEANFELYNAATKKSYAAYVSAQAKVTFKGGDKKSAEGYVVYSVPAETNIDDLYIGINQELQTRDWSKEDVNTLLGLKKVAFDGAEKTVDLNAEFEVETGGFNVVKKAYRIKSITYNCNDQEVKRVLEENPYYAGDVFIRVTVEVEHLSGNTSASIYTPYLIWEYGTLSSEYDFENDLPSEVEPGEILTIQAYYRTSKGAKILKLVGEDSDDYDFSLDL